MQRQKKKRGRKKQRNASQDKGKERRIGSISKKRITVLSRQCGFEKHSKNKTRATSLITAFIAMMRTGEKSYLAWSRSLASEIKETVSKQAIFEKMDEPWLTLLKLIIQEVVAMQSMKNVKQALLKHFKNVWIQDSTSIKLPGVMVEKFKGNISLGEQKSVAKINVVLNVLTGLCPVMNLMGLTVNEQQLSDSILSIAQAGDLVIRDLGYAVLAVFIAMDEAGIFFVSRLKYNVGLYDVQTGDKIELTQLLKGKSYSDIKVKCGKKEQFEVRLIAIKLSPEQAAERRRKAKKDRDKRLNHSDDYYALLDYVIFITNVEQKIWNYKEVAQAYSVRWNIEILFKSWKSGFKIEDMIPDDNTHTVRVEGYIYLMLLYIAWFLQIIFVPLRWAVEEQYGKQLSIIKTVNYVMANFHNWLFEDIDKKDIAQLAYFCSYDKRRRPNAVADLDLFYKQFA